MVRKLADHAPNQMPPEQEQQMLDTALEQFLLHGIAGISMDKIAKAAGVSKATIYRRFSSKEALFGAVLLDRAKKLATQLSEIDISGLRPRQALTKYAQEHRRITFVNINFHRMVIHETVRFPEYANQVRQIIRDPIAASISSLFQDLVAQGHLAKMPNATQVQAFIMISAGGWRMLFGAMDPADTAEQNQLLADLESFFEWIGLGED